MPKHLASRQPHRHKSVNHKIVTKRKRNTGNLVFGLIGVVVGFGCVVSMLFVPPATEAIAAGQIFTAFTLVIVGLCLTEL